MFMAYLCYIFIYIIWIKLERINVCDPLKILAFDLRGFILHAQKNNYQNKRIYMVIIDITSRTCSASASGEKM